MVDEDMPKYESFQERIVREAIERGDFDNLPGQGKPLKMKYPGDPDWWIRDKVEREKLGDDLREASRDPQYKAMLFADRKRNP